MLSSPLGVAAQPYLADHKVHGQLVVPGAAYLAMLASGAELLGWSSCRIEEVYFLAPLVLLDTKARTVQAVLTPEETGGGAAPPTSCSASTAPGSCPRSARASRIWLSAMR